MNIILINLESLNLIISLTIYYVIFCTIRVPAVENTEPREISEFPHSRDADDPADGMDALL